MKFIIAQTLVLMTVVSAAHAMDRPDRERPMTERPMIERMSNR